MKILKVLTRVYLSQAELESVITFYESIFKESCRLRFSYPDAGLELANVGSMLLLAGSDEALRPFKATQTTFIVDSLDDFKEKLVPWGAVIIEAPKQVPTGANMRVKHPDGLIIEYVEHMK